MRSLRLLPTAIVALAGVASAERPVPGEAPTRGPEIPAGVIAGDPDATAVVLNPSNLGFLPSWNAVLLYGHAGSGAPRGPGGGGLYLAAPLPYLKSLSAGLAVEFVRPPDTFPYRDEGKLSLALAWHPLRSLSFGLGYAHVWTGETVGADGIDTLDLSATGRLGRLFSLGFVVHDVPSPQFRGLGIQRVYQTELAFRPIGNDRLELAASLWVGERRDVNPGFRFAAMPLDGLLVRGRLEVVPDLYGDRNGQWDLRATLGLELNLQRAGAGGYALFGGGSGGARYDGFAITARISGDRYPPLVRLRRFERIDLASGGDRKLAPILAHLHQLARDGRAEGIVAVIGDLDGSWATMEELREAFRALRAAGKHVFVYAADLGTKSYYAAAAAERIYLDPAGGLRLVGLAATTLYFKGALDKLGVQAEFVKIAEYKTAPEQLTRTGPSDDAERVRAAILDDVYGRLLAGLADDRRIPVERARALVDAGPYSAAAAQKAGLVDELKHGDEVEDAIGERLGHHIDARPPDPRPRRPRSFAPPAIAIVYVDGDIIDGKSRTIPLIDRRLVGHESIIAALTEARADARVEAIVLRVDSPGGSALASDLIAREVERTRQVKPVICSFGDTAASGGYFVAAGCDAIFAEPSTITGSIGIFTGKVDLSGLGAKLGIHADVGRRGAHADLESWWRPYSEEERALLLQNLRYYYERFVETVARGRHLSLAAVDAVGRGRVWTGAEAREHKLVDQLGGLMAAVAEAKRRAGFSDGAELELEAYPAEPETLLGKLVQFLGIDVDERASLASIPSLGELLRALPAALVAEPSTPQARLPFELRWR